MNRRQRILFTIVVSFVGLIEGLIIFAFMELEVTGGALAILMIFLATLPLAAGIYFLSFKIWDNKKQEVRENQEPENSLTKKQRILLALIITYVFPIELLLATGLDILTGENLAFWMLIPISIIMAVGFYFLSFKIWGKKKQEVRADQEPVDVLTKKQRILLALIITSVFPVEMLVVHGLGLVMGVTITLLSLITAVIIAVVVVYFLSFKVWKKTEQGAADDGRPRENPPKPS